MSFSRFKNRMIAKIITKFPSLSSKFTESYSPWESDDIPWIPVRKNLRDSKVAIVTTSGVHNKEQTPFNMEDKDGDPSFRIIDTKAPLSDLMITHDYYDHTDADKDINVVFPIERLWEFRKEGIIGAIADKHYAFMGHIDGHHIYSLINDSAPEIAKRLKNDGVNAVLLTPG